MAHSSSLPPPPLTYNPLVQLKGTMGVHRLKGHQMEHTIHRVVSANNTNISAINTRNIINQLIEHKELEIMW